MDMNLWQWVIRPALRALNRSVLVGKPAPVVAEIYAYMTTVLPGDWCYEQSTLMRNDARHGLGRFILKRREPMDVGPDWPVDEEVPQDTFWYVETPDGELARWWNCDFYSIPLECWDGRRETDKGYARNPDRVRENEAWAEEAAIRHGLVTP